MFASLETRVPFLDHRIIEFAWSLPLEMKLKNGVGKIIIKNINGFQLFLLTHLFLKKNIYTNSLKKLIKKMANFFLLILIIKDIIFLVYGHKIY